MQTNWESQYFEKNKNELHTNIFKSLEIEKYLKKVLKNSGFNLHDLKINFANFVINILVLVRKSEYKTFIFKKRAQININNFHFQTKKVNSLKKQIKKRTFIIKNFSNKLKSKILYLYKQRLLKLKTCKKVNFEGLSKKILENLNLFTHNKFQINFIIQEINFISSSASGKQNLVSFRKFEKTAFFKESIHFFIGLVTRKRPAQSISNFITTQLEETKNHNFFFNFLQEISNLIVNQKFSYIEGIKIIIAGRINGALRSRAKVIKSGEISLLALNSKINYSESTAFTSNGTLGVKVWVCEKKTNKMFLQPKKTTYKKTKKGTLRELEFKTKKLKFGTIGLKAVKSGMLSARQLEAARQAISRKIKKKGKIWVRVFPDSPITAKSLSARMGKGKGTISHWSARVKGGTILFEMCGIKDCNIIKNALRTGRAKLPLKTKVIHFNKLF